MEIREVEGLIKTQKEYFYSGKTMSVSARKKTLILLRKAIEQYEGALCEALKKDLGKSRSESYMCEIGLVQSEISYMLSHVSRFAREKTVLTPIASAISHSFEKPSPYGCVLIMSPWNYPFLLSLDPLVDALAAGNTVILKPSAYSPNTSAVIKEMLEGYFPKGLVAVVTGGRAENQSLLAAKFDYIFFTGSKNVGREVMACAAKNLTPLTLELGGKSPCIVDKTADLPLTAKRIVFGKFLNCGQTCVAPDYIYCDAAIKDRLIEELKKEIKAQYGERPLENKNYGKIVNEKHFMRLQGLLEKDKIVFGGSVNQEMLQIAPTIMDSVTFDDKIMKEEIFGPVLPVVTYDRLKDAVAKLRTLPEPLALYIFSSNKKSIAYVNAMLSFGGGCVNDTIVHLATSTMGFGGVGESGMGAYHGKRGFDAFTHYKSIMDKKTYLDLPIRYQPYGKIKDTLVRMFVR